MRGPFGAGMRRRVRMPSIYEGAAIGVALLAMGGIAYATIPSDGVISACYLKPGGSLRVIDATTGKCSAKETSLAWNVAGAQGPAGPAGPTGPEGPTGATGAAGADGVGGYEVVQTRRTNVPLPFTDYVMASCPAGKHVLSGGYLAQLYSDFAFLRLGEAPLASLPSDDTWQVRFSQDASGGATNATFTVTAICATVGS